MPARAHLDPTKYVTTPILDVAGTVALGLQLVGLVPRGLAADPRHAARSLRDSLVTLQDRWRQRDRASTPALRPLDLALDNAWSALLQRIEAWLTVREAEPELALRASKVIAALFPHRLEFTRLELANEWTESKKRLDRIAEERLRDELVALAGEDFVTGLETAHANLGRALGLDGRPAPATPDSVDLLAPLRETRAAIVDYAVQLVAAHRRADAELAASIQKALAPIDAARTARPSAPAPATPEVPVTPDTPIPPLPEEA